MEASPRTKMLTEAIPSLASPPPRLRDTCGNQHSATLFHLACQQLAAQLHTCVDLHSPAWLALTGILGSCGSPLPVDQNGPSWHCGFHPYILLWICILHSHGRPFLKYLQALSHSRPMQNLLTHSLHPSALLQTCPLQYAFGYTLSKGVPQAWPCASIPSRCQHHYKVTPVIKRGGSIHAHQSNCSPTSGLPSGLNAGSAHQQKLLTGQHRESTLQFGLLHLWQTLDLNQLKPMAASDFAYQRHRNQTLPTAGKKSHCR